MTNPGTALLALYPAIDPVSGLYIVADHLDGNGPQIIYWNTERLGPQPTQEQLDAAPLPVPQTITAVQARIAMHRANIFDQVQAVITAQNNPEISIYWEYAITWERNNAILAQLTPLINLSSAQVDDLFRTAALIT